MEYTNKKHYTITIDGYSGTGKSTLCKELAKMFPGFIYLNTGSIFRALALDATSRGLDLTDEEQINDYMYNVVRLDYDNGITLYGEPIKFDTGVETGKLAAKIAKHACVPEKLTEFQQFVAKKQNMIIDGRCGGIGVFPYADVKLFVTCSIAERARRAAREMVSKRKVGINNFEDAYDYAYREIADRDYHDITREIEPVRRAPDAIVLDTSNLNKEECVAAAYTLVRNSLMNSIIGSTLKTGKWQVDLSDARRETVGDREWERLTDAKEAKTNFDNEDYSDGQPYYDDNEWGSWIPRQWGI